MARSFGRKNEVNRDIFAYNMMLLGEAGVGKTTMVSEIMRKFCNEDQYLMLQIGKEDGCKAIQGLMWEQISTWKEFTDFVSEVVTNRVDWETLKCVTIDTIDSLIDICTPFVIKQWNQSQMGKKDFTPAKTLNQSWGGFGKADEYMMGLILDQIWKLKSVGVSVFIIGHTRRRENVDPVSGLTFSTLSASISLKNFDALKTKMDIVSIAFIDREVVTKDFGRENIVTHKQNTINEVTSEARRCAFRSSAYVLDSKCRFPNIIDSVPLNAEAFVQAIQDAIDDAAGVATGTPAPIKTETPKATKKSTPAPVVVEPEEDEVEPDELDIEVDDDLDITTEVEEDTFDADAARTQIRNLNKTGTPEQKAQVKATLNGVKLNDADVETLKAILEIFE